MFPFAVVSFATVIFVSTNAGALELEPYHKSFGDTVELTRHLLGEGNDNDFASRLGHLLDKQANLDIALRPIQSQVKKYLEEDNHLSRSLEALFNKKGGQDLKLLRQKGTKLDFVADVVVPIQLENKLNRDFDGSDHHRQLQPVCGVAEDNSIICALDDFPREGLVTVFLDCTDGGTVANCLSCAILEEDSVDQIDQNDPRCNACSTCGDAVSFDCSNIDPGVACAVQNCNNDCIGPGGNPPTPTPPTPTPPSSNQNGCGVASDGSIVCAVDDAPANGLVSVFGGCVEQQDGTVSVFDCQTCAIVLEDTIGELDSSDPKCNSCSTCGGVGQISFDCSNLVPNEACGVVDCNGNCVGGSTPTPPTPTPPTPTPPTPTSPTFTPPNPTPGTPSPPSPSPPTGGFFGPAVGAEGPNSAAPSLGKGACLLSLASVFVIFTF